MGNDEIFLIHGTGAAAASDSGSAWWQCGGRFSDFLARELGLVNTLIPGKVFHWSGANSERERRLAARQLGDWLLGFESLGERYHLICHSHGGSIAWLALCEATKRGKSLTGLKSWCTVGTPFLRFVAEPANGWLLIPLTLACSALGVSSAAVKSSLHYAPTLFVDGDLLSIAALGALLVASVALVLGGFFCAYRFIVCGLGSVQAWREQRLEAETLALYGQRWRGFWSTSDEAINGLASTLGFRGEIVPRMRRLRQTLFGRLIWRATYPFAWVYNEVIAKVSDEFIWDRISRRSQGSDIRGRALVEVRTSPHKDDTSPLPSNIELKLLELSNANAAATLGRVRNVLAARSKDELPVVLNGLTREVRWNELVHNSYLDIPEIQQLIIDAITKPTDTVSRSANAGTPALSSAGGQLLSNTRLGGYVSAALVSVILLMAWIGVITLHSAYIDPYTDEYQIRYILMNAPTAGASDDGRVYEVDIDRPVSVWIKALLTVGMRSEADQATVKLKLGSTAQVDASAILAVDEAAHHHSDRAINYGNPRSAVVVGLVKGGYDELAIAVALKANRQRDRSQLLLDIATATAGAGRKDIAKRALDLAMQPEPREKVNDAALTRAEDLRRRARAKLNRSRALTVMALLGLGEEVLLALKEVDSPTERTALLTALVKHTTPAFRQQFDAGISTAAFSAYRELRQAAEDDASRADIAVVLAKTHETLSAIGIARGIENLPHRATALSRVAVELAKNGQIKMRKTVVAEAYRLAEDMLDRPGGSIAFREVVLNLARAGNLFEAQRLVQRAGRDAPTRGLPDVLFKEGQRNEAIALANAYLSTDRDADLSRTALENGFVELARRLAERVSLERRSAMALVKVAGVYADLSEHQRSRSALKGAQELAEKDVSGELDVCEFSRDAASAYAALNELRNARLAADRCQSSSYRLLAYAAIIRSPNAASTLRALRSLH